MDFLEVIEQARAALQSKGRLTYRTLKRQFALDDEALDDLKYELIEGQEVAIDKDGKMLVWVGKTEEEKGERIREKGRKGEREHEGKRGKGEPESTPDQWTPAHLADRIRAVSITDGERKTITALFADLKGSTALIEGLDPEEAQAIIDPALQLMMEAVHQYDGFVAQALGDGIFALFGAPLAHEDHPQRAVYTALRMQDTMRRYGETLRQKGYPPLLMRVGLNTGEVVLRSIRKDDLHADYVPVGHSTNLAARMEQLATPGSIVVSAYTHRLTDGYFAFKDLGPTQIKGVEEPLHIYEVLGAGPLRTRLQVSASRYGLTRFVGRQSEMEQLKRALEQAKAGHGQIVGVMGEPGLGKSRLFHEFKLLSLGGCLVLEAYSVSHGKTTAYFPVIELLKSYFRLESQDDERTRREKVGGKVLMLDRNLEDTLPYLFALLGIEEQPSPLAQMDPQIRRRRTFDALKKLFLRESLNQPLVLISEDLHWIDGETQGFLDVLSESVASAKLLLLTNYRPEYRHEWGQKTYYTQLRLAPFGKAEAEEFLDVLLGTSVGAQHAAPLQSLKQLILDKTQGTPFFMEEIVQELREQGVLPSVGATHASPLPQDLHIPTTVQAVLAARIDRLAPDEKALLQQLAVIGRQFPMSLIRHVIAQPEAEIYRLLVSLQHKEFLYEQPAFPESECIFKHALTQDVAYGTVLQEQRKGLHERTAQAIEQMYKDKVEDHYSELAHHYGHSGNTDKAITYLHLAGQQAVQRSTYTEAINDLTAALELLRTLPDTTERAQRELSVHVTLGPALITTKGWAAWEVGQAYARARELCRQVGETPHLCPVLFGMWAFYVVRAEHRMAYELGKQLSSLAQSIQDPTPSLQAHVALGNSSVWLGELASAREHLEQGIALYEPQRHHSLAFLYGGADPGVHDLSYMALALWLLGYPDQALKMSHEALTIAQDLSHPFILAWALSFAAWLHQVRRERQATQERAESAIALSTEQGFPFWLGWATVLRGWTLTEQGQGEKGIAQMHQGLATYRATGAGMGQSDFLALLAEGYGGAGQINEGLAAVAEALQLVDKNDERFYEAELYRLKGELTLQSKTSLGQVEDKSQTSRSPSEIEQEVEACFLKAIDIAQRQQAKSLELRAVMSLARLWQSQGKPAEARQRLAEIYGWFTEGFDTKDLQEAKALIEELSHRVIGRLSD
ncbi:MAG: adenylate/guanylate cyclase domain-containing protein [Candidatus Binatia bacterium]